MRYILDHEPHLPYADPVLQGAVAFPDVEPIQPGLPGETDEQILAYAEEHGDRTPSAWDRLETLEYGVDPAEMSVRALYARFTSNMQRKADWEDMMGAPGKFIEAVWQSQRRIPTASEYANRLSGTPFLTAAESKVATTAAINRKDNEAVAGLHEANEDDQLMAERVRDKLLFYINTVPGAFPDQQAVIDAASEYADLLRRAARDRIHGGSIPKVALRAEELLWTARGLSAEEIALIRQPGKNEIEQRYAEYRSLGIPTELAQHMADTPKHSGFSLHPALSVDMRMTESLRGGLDTQLAVRHYLGIENLYRWLSWQRETQLHISTENRNRDLTVSLMNAALARGEDDTAQSIVDDYNARTEAAPERSIWDIGTDSPEESEAYRQMAEVVICEPALRETVAYFVNWNMMGSYRSVLDDRAPSAR